MQKSRATAKIEFDATWLRRRNCVSVASEMPTTRLLRFSIAAALAAQCVQCGGLLSSDSDPTGGSGGGVSSGGSAGIGDASVGDASVGGTGGFDASGVDASTPYTQQVIRACAKAASCGSAIPPTPNGPFGVSSCIDAFGQQSGGAMPVGAVFDPDIAQRLIDCTSASSCAEYFACFGGNWVGVSRCREGAGCKDNKLSEYASGSPTFDCTVLGATCFELYSGAIRSCCNQKLCTDSLNSVNCNGTKGSYCHGWGAYFEFDCADSGRVCSEDPTALCMGTGAACAPEQPVTCSGDVASYCSGGKLASVDCGKNPFRSACGSNAYEPCVPRGSDCSTDYQGGCEGSALSYCFDGKIERIDCTSVGFSTCDVDLNGNARCRE